MVYADENDIIRCTKVVQDEFHKKNINIDKLLLTNVTVDIMEISYSTGGGYSNEIIRSYAETYIEEGFYNKFL